MTQNYNSLNARGCDQSFLVTEEEAGCIRNILHFESLATKLGVHHESDVNSQERGLAMDHLDRVHIKDKNTEIYLEVQKLREIIATTQMHCQNQKTAFGGLKWVSPRNC